MTQDFTRREALLAALFERHGLPFAPITRPHELLEDPHLLATGGLAPIVVPESETITHHNPDLTLVGLRLVFEKNID